MTNFLKTLDEEIQNSYFENGLRASQIKHGFAKTDMEIKEKREGLDSKIAKLALDANQNRKHRHEKVQDSMLKTDKATVATEIPVWYYSKKKEETITGHIDILQTRNDKIHVLDYKPEAEEVKPVYQLFTYIQALSYRTGWPVDRFKAAWFNHNTYKEIEF